VTEYPVLTSAEAEADIAEARDRYRTVSEGLEKRFQEAVEACIAEIRRHLTRYPIVHRSLRRILLRKFPYFVLFAVFEDTVVVFGGIHMRRNPTEWQSRA
jgi:toxin ParE1/3/4